MFSFNSPLIAYYFRFAFRVPCFVFFRDSGFTFAVVGNFYRYVTGGGGGI